MRKDKRSGYECYSDISYQGGRIKNNFVFWGAAVLPVLFMLTAYARMGFWPFGDKTLYTWDLEKQYSSFMVLLRHLLTGQEHIGYSLTGGLGGNLYGLTAYYLGSPFNIITLFFDERTMPVGIMILILFKTACMGLFMFLYLYKKKPSPAAILFSTAYALSAYAIAYQSNIMWLDALVFLPLVILGLESLIREGKCLLYMVSLSLTIISNYFTAYMVCLFVVFYFAGFMALMERKESGFGKSLKTTGRFVISSLASGGLSAFLLLPVLYEMQSGMGKQNVEWEAIGNGAKFFYYRSVLPVLMACSYNDGQRWEAIGNFPLLYCGMIAIPGVVLFFILRDISWKKKLFRIFLMALVLVSCDHMNLFFIWHGFYTPFGAPWRFVFLWDFIVLAGAYEGAAMFLKEKKKIYEGVALAVICIFFFWVFWRFEAYREVVIFNAGVALCEITGLFLWKYGKRYGKVVSGVLCILGVGAELVCNALFTWGQGFEYESYLTYEDYIDRMENTVADEEDLYRCVLTGEAKRNLNDGFLWDLNTIESYTSTAKEKTQEIGEYLNLGELKIIGTYNADATLLTKNIVSLRYIYGGETADSGYEKIKTTEDGINIYENKNILPFGFLVNQSALDITSEDKEQDICEKQNALFHALAGSRGMEERNVCKDKALNTEKSKDGDEEEKAGSHVEDTELVKRAVEITAESTLNVTSETASDVTSRVRNDLGETAYVCYSVPYERGWKAVVDGKETIVMEGMGGLLLVPVEEGEHEVRITYRAPGSKMGVWISLLCLAGVVIYVFRQAKKKPFQVVGFKV